MKNLRKFFYPFLIIVTLFYMAMPQRLQAHNTGIPHKEYSAEELRDLGLEELIVPGETLRVNGPTTQAELWRAWNFDPWVMATLAIVGSAYLIGVGRLWKATRPGSGITKTQAFWYFLGWLWLFLALMSPLHPWGEVLFSAHMTQHEILMLIVAPLLVMGQPIVAYLWALPLSWRKNIGRFSTLNLPRKFWHFLTDPFFTWLVHAVILWAWHIPSWFEATLTNEFVHTLQHASFLGSALLFWWAILYGRRRTLGYGMGILYLFTTAVHSGALGALLIFTTTAWYPAYAETAQLWGYTALEDQQLGGLIMWIPAGIIYIIAALIMFTRWMCESERRALKNEALWQSGHFCRTSGTSSPAIGREP